LLQISGAETTKAADWLPFDLAVSPGSGASALFGEGGQRRKIDRPGPALDHFPGMLPIGKPDNQLGELTVQQLAHRGIFYGQMIVLKDAAAAGQETVEMGIGFPQELQHIKHEQSARRESAAYQPVQVIRFQSVGSEVPDPFLAVTTVRCLKVSAGNGTSDLLFGHRKLRHVCLHRILPENHRQGNSPS